METPEEGGTGTQAPSARHSRSIRGSVRSVGIQHNIKEEPEEETAHIWETQWQDFLNTVDVSPSPLQDPYFPPEDTPWDDAQAFLASFEQVAKACRWPREEWVDRLRPALTGEAELTFSSLEDGDREDYGKVKAAILQEDVLGREKSRQRFRSFCYLEAVGPRGVYGHLRELCARWLKVERHSKEQILEELVLEQFLAILPPEIQAWVKEHPLESSTQAVFLAEEFLRSQWVPEVKEEQMAQLHGAGPAHLPEDEGLPQNAGVGLRLLRESKAEELTDLSDTDLSADGGEVYEEHESHPEEPSPPRTLQVISLGRASDNGPQLSHQQNGRREGRRPARRCAPKRSQDSICREAMKNTGRHACLVCGKSFTRKWTLKQHQIKHHPSHSREETLPQGVQAREDGRDKSDVESQQSASSGEHPCVCSHCGESFSSKILLVIHQSTHVGDLWPPSLPEVTLYICRECGETFDCLQDHDSHQETHSGQRPRASVEWEEEEEEEEETETPSSPRPQGEEQPYICTDCGKSFVTRLWYKKHQVLHRRKKALFFYNPKRKTCSICGSTFPNFWKLRQHQKSHQQTNPDRSARGQSRFGQNRGLIKRGSVPQSEKAEPPPRREPGGPRKPYQCTHCERRFLRPANLVRHQSVHSAKRRYPCARCGRRFMTKRALCDHEKHCPRGKKLVPRLAPEPLAKPAPRLTRDPLAKVLSTTCPDCGKRFCSTSSMQRHRRMHSGEKFYRCEDCGKTFMWDSTYYTHRRKVHHWQAGAHPVRRETKEKEKAYPCNQCGVTFKRASLLATHRCAPADKTQLICTDCGRTFSTPSALERHQRNHRKKKPESALRRRPPVGKKPFACAKCGRRFDFPWHLKLHQRIHLAVKPLKCSECGERFLWPLCLFRHQKKAHGGVKKAPLSPDTPSVPQGALSRRNRGKRFAKQPDLVRHRRMHAAEKPLKLPGCPRSVQGRLGKDRKDRRETQENPPGETVSVPKPKEFPCSVCGARFNTYPDLVSHRHVHGEGKLHKCTDCGKNFSQPSSLKRHWKEIHKRKKLVPVLHRIPDLEKKPFNCSEYEKKLHQPLEKPRYRITSEKGEALTCSVCGEQFTFRIGLVRHQAVHREVRRHTCGECGKKFIHLNNLLKHKRTHDGFQKLTLQVFGSDLQVTGSRSSPPPAVTVTHENSNGAPPLDSVEASRGPPSVEEPPL